MPISRGHVLGFSLLAAVALYATWPGYNSLDYSSCEAKSSLSQLSANIYGRYFWEQALTSAHRLANMKTTQSRWADAERIERQGEQLLEEIYAKHPSLAPTSAERAAKRLRERADQIEAQDSLSQFSAMEREMKASVLNCVRIITQKLRDM